MKNNVETVQAFLDLHKNEFLPMPDYVTIFSNMIGGVYGECRRVSDNQNLYELEISGNETKSGNPVLFTFRDFQEMWVCEECGQENLNEEKNCDHCATLDTEWSELGLDDD